MGSYSSSVPCLDTTVYLLYGNSAINSSQTISSQVWNNGYVGVYDLANGTTLHLNDSSAANNNLTNNNAGAAAGEIDGGASFNGGQYSYLNSPVLLPTGTAARSLSAWVQMTTNSNFEDNGEEIAGWGDNNGAGDRWAIFWTGSSMGIEGLNLAHLPT